MGTVESQLRSVADSLVACRNQAPFNSETYRMLNWASMEIHNIAQRLRGISQSLIEGGEWKPSTGIEGQRVEAEKRW